MLPEGRGPTPSGKLFLCVLWGLVFMAFAASCRTRVLGNICVLQSTFPLASGEALEAIAILSSFR